MLAYLAPGHQQLSGWCRSLDTYQGHPNIRHCSNSITYTCGHTTVLHQPRLWFFTGGYLVKRWFIPAAARARGQSNDLNREFLASNLFNCHKEVINAHPVPSISRCIHTFYRHKNIWEYQWSNFICNCMSTFLHYVHCKDALLDCSDPGGERCESLTWVDEIVLNHPYSPYLNLFIFFRYYVNGRTATVDDFTSAEVLDYLPQQIHIINETMAKAGYHGYPMWLGETSSAYGGGAPGLSDRYVAGFL